MNMRLIFIIKIMSYCIDVDKISAENVKKISGDLEVEIKNRYQSHFAQKKYLVLYRIDGASIYIPFYYAYKLFGIKPNRNIGYEKMSDEVSFIAKLYPRQQEVRKELVQLFNRDGCAFLAAYPGWGKTAFGTYMMCKVGLKTAILSHRVVISNQWVESFKRFTGTSRIKIAKTAEKWSDDVDVYIINPMIVSRMHSFPFNKFGFLICDEAHSYCSPKTSQAFTYFTPKYTLGLSATPDEKKDGTGVTLTHYFGEKIYRKFYQDHHVYYYRTDFVPEYMLNAEGKTDWDSVLRSQATDENRNALLINIALQFPQRNILFLCKRKVQARYLLDELKERGEDVDIYIASQKKVNYDCRILISTYSKGGVGFDHPKLNMLILASDVEALIQQYIGRVFRGGKSLPEGEKVIVIDLVDNFPILENHWRTRRRYLKKIGGKIMDYKKHFTVRD